MDASNFPDGIYLVDFEFHPEHGIGQEFDHLAPHFEKFFFRHPRSISAGILVHRGAP